jgi:hypothetical protein
VTVSTVVVVSIGSWANAVGAGMANAIVASAKLGTTQRERRRVSRRSDITRRSYLALLLSPKPARSVSSMTMERRDALGSCTHALRRGSHLIGTQHPSFSAICELFLFRCLRKSR